MSIKVYTTKTSINRSLLVCESGLLRLGVRVTSLRVRLALWHPPLPPSRPPRPPFRVKPEVTATGRFGFLPTGLGRPAGAAESGRCHFQGTSLRGTRAPGPRRVKITASIKLAAPGPGVGLQVAALRTLPRLGGWRAGSRSELPGRRPQRRASQAGASERAAAACLSRRQRRRV
jgi:hypothetical protein